MYRTAPYCKVPVKNVLQQLPETLRLCRHAAVDAGGQQRCLLYTVLHDLPHAFVVHPAHDLPDEVEAEDPVVAVGVDQLVAVEDCVADLLGCEDVVAYSVVQDVKQLLLLLTVAEMTNYKYKILHV